MYIFYSPGIIFNFDQHGNSFYQVFLQSDQAGWDNSAQKLKHTNLAVFDHFGIVKYKIFGASGGFALSGPPPETCPVLAGGLTAPQTLAGLGNDLRSMHRPGQHFFHIHIGRVL